MLVPNKCFLATRIAKRFNPMDRFLQWQLGSKYIHSEIVFPIKYGQISFSSRRRVKNTRKKIKGVQFDYVDYNKGHWRLDDLKLKDYQIDSLYKNCKSWIGASYDAKGAVLMAGFGFNIEDADKFWCSEICAAVLLDFFKFSNFHIKPKRLLNIVLDHTT